MKISRSNNGLLNNLKAFISVLDADPHLNKFKLDFMSSEGFGHTVYICNDYAIGIATSSEVKYVNSPEITAKEVITNKINRNVITSNSGYIHCDVFEPHWCVAKDGKVHKNRWWHLIEKYDLLLTAYSTRTNLLPDDYSRYPQTKALMDFILENNDEQLRLGSLL